MAPFAGSSNSKAKNNLVAILLVTRSRPGPKLVFHYPPVPTRSTARNSNGNTRDQDDFSDDESSDSDGDGPGKSRSRGRGESDSTVRHVGSENGALPENPQERLFGHGVESLERLLCPGRWSDGEKFEIGLDGITFTGHPVYAKEDGTWAKAKAKGDAVPRLPVKQQLSSKSSRTLLTETTSVEDFAASSAESSGVKGGITITAPTDSNTVVPPPAPLHDFTHMPDSLDSRGTASLGTSMNSASTTSGALAEQLTMFHVVFALSTSPTAVSRAENTKARILHDEVAKKLSKALKYCQKQNNYISLESRRLLALKSKAKIERLDTAALWMQMLESSELAWALRETYEQISHGNIATIRLDGMELSLQIPLPLTNPTSSTRQLEDPGDIDLGTTTLLLQIDKDTLLRTANLPPSLAYFIRESTPTKSLLKHSTNLTLPASTLTNLAHHLITWRKARLIAPLHPRNTYIPNPDTAADRDWRALSAAYAKNFPALPGLERMLSLLGRGVKYGMLIQSRDHRAPYMEILAWLMREELVVQMRTFGWLVINSSPNAAVEDESDTESLPSTQTAFPAASSNQKNDSTGLILDPTDPAPTEAAQIRRLSAAVEDAELRDRIPDLLQYFNGQHAFEEIAAREGLKRAKVEGWLSWLEDEGWLRSVRYV